MEIDLITRENGRFRTHEIKSSSVVRPQFFKNLTYWLALEKTGEPGRVITSRAEEASMPHGMKNIYWKDL